MTDLRSKYTANFKRDFVAGSAVVIFFLIVISEIVLAISLPLYMKRENVMAVAVRRLQLIASFDDARNKATNLKVNNETAEAEIALLRWNLNRMAEYLRKYVKYLSSNDIAVLQQQVNEMRVSLHHLEKVGPFTKANTIDYAPYLHQIMKKSGVIK